MCKDAAGTAASLMAAIEPELQELLTLTGVNPTQSKTVTDAFNAAETALKAWVSRTSGQEVLELTQDFQTVFNAVPLPTQYQALGNIILAGILGVEHVIIANEPASVTVVTAAATAKVGAAKIKVIVPNAPKIDLHAPEKAAEQFTNFFQENKLKAQAAFAPAVAK